MTTLVWTGVALWLGLNAAIAARRVYLARPANSTPNAADIVHMHKPRA